MSARTLGLEIRSIRNVRGSRLSTSRASTYQSGGSTSRPCGSTRRCDCFRNRQADRRSAVIEPNATARAGLARDGHPTIAEGRKIAQERSSADAEFDGQGAHGRGLAAAQDVG